MLISRCIEQLHHIILSKMRHNLVQDLRTNTETIDSPTFDIDSRVTKTGLQISLAPPSGSNKKILQLLLLTMLMMTIMSL